MLKAIVAVDENWGIGYNGDLLVSIPDDLKHFKNITTGSTVVMGLNTWNSLPRKPLPNRTNIVIRPGTPEFDQGQSVIKMDLETLLERFELDGGFVIGGGSIYKQLLPYCDQVYITKIYKNFENVDTFFPNLDATGEWVAKPIDVPHTYNDLTYQFWVYDRIS